MKKLTVSCTAKVWVYPGDAAWYFVHIPATESAALSSAYGPKKRGWGSIPVRATIGTTTWASSVFPDKRSGTYLLPIKRAVRNAEEIDDGDSVRLTVSIDHARTARAQKATR